MALQVAIVGVSAVDGGPGSTGPGLITGTLGLLQYADGDIVAVVGDAIAPHGPAPHDAAVMATGSLDTFVNGRALCHVLDLASCGCHVLEGDVDTFTL